MRASVAWVIEDLSAERILADKANQGDAADGSSDERQDGNGRGHGIIAGSRCATTEP
jgi:hypothetical protein